MLSEMPREFENLWGRSSSAPETVYVLKKVLFKHPTKCKYLESEGGRERKREGARKGDGQYPSTEVTLVVHLSSQCYDFLFL